MRKAVNIQWSYDEQEPFEAIEEMSADEASELLGIPFKTYANMTTAERYDYVADVIRHCPAVADEILSLPDKVTIPEALTDDGDIADWISDTFGFCIEGFQIEEEAE